MALRYCQGTVIGKGSELDKEGAVVALRKAMRGLGTDEKAIIDILSTHNNDELQAIKEHYKTCYGRNLGQDFISELSGHFEKLCLYLLLPRRHYEACCLHRAIEGLGTDERTLIEILCTRTNYQIQGIKEAYRERFGRSLDEDIRGDTSSHFEHVLVGILQASRSEEQMLDGDLIEQDLKHLYKAGMKKLGTDEDVFTRILVSRSIPHLQEVFRTYGEVLKHSIRHAIQKETSGSLRDAYMTIVRHIEDPTDYLVDSFHEAMLGPGTDDERLMQLVVTHCETDLKDVAEAYLKKYNMGLSRAIHDDTSGDYRKLLMRLTNI